MLSDKRVIYIDKSNFFLHLLNTCRQIYTRMYYFVINVLPLF